MFNFKGKDHMSGIVSALNQPFIKQGIKNVVGAVTFAIGARALYDYSRGKIYSEYATGVIDGPKRRIDEIALSLAQTSFILSTTVTPMGVWMISAAQLEKPFGPNTTFEQNWKHPRHIMSFVSLGLALPLVANCLYRPYAFGKERYFERCAFFMVLTSRPVLHLGNQLAHKIFSRCVR